MRRCLLVASVCTFPRITDLSAPLHALIGHLCIFLEKGLFSSVYSATEVFVLCCS